MPIYNASLRQINLQEAKRYAGLAKTNFDEKMLKKACLDVQVLSKVQGSWEIWDYNAASAEIKASPPAYIEGNKIRNFLHTAEKLIFLSITIGDAVEKSITDCFKAGQYAYSLLLDAAATAAVENAGDEMEKHLRHLFQSKGYQLLPRFSPGYGDWDIKFQPVMLSLAQAAAIHISLTESFMLVPRKSITAVIGLVPNQMPVTQDIPCRNCTKINCLARKEIKE